MDKNTIIKEFFQAFFNKFEKDFDKYWIMAENGEFDKLDKISADLFIQTLAEFDMKEAKLVLEHKGSVGFKTKEVLEAMKLYKQIQDSFSKAFKEGFSK